MTGKREGLAHSVQVRLAQHAKAINVDPNLVLTRYGVERFLYRLSQSQHAERFVLKGALLLLAWMGETLRPTRDADLLGFGDLSDDALAETFREVCSVEVEPDAVDYLADSVEVEPIREDNDYGGRRVSLRAQLGTARLPIQVDVGIGDAVVPPPEWLEYPSLLGLPSPRLRAYPREAVVAEKVHTMVMFGARSSRMKDYFDVLALLREGEMDTENLASSIAATFQRRRTTLPEALPTGLSDEFAMDPAKQAQWRAFLRNNRMGDTTLEEVVAEIRDGLAAPLGQARRKAES